MLHEFPRLDLTNVLQASLSVVRRCMKNTEEIYSHQCTRPYIRVSNHLRLPS